MIYLDYNATAPLRPSARAAMLAVLDRPCNASAVHAHGRAGRQVVEQARMQIGALVGAPASQVVFNSGATEANNTVLRYFAQRFSGEQILVSTIEHPSVLEAVPHAQKIPVMPDGVVDMTVLEHALKEKKTALVSVMAVNNETGVIQPVAEIAALAHRHGALFHCDAVQAAGRIPLNISVLGIDFLSLSAHKIGGPQGAGALVLGSCGLTPVLLHGGGQEKKARAGTENVAGIAGFGAAAQDAVNFDAYHSLSALRGDLERQIKNMAPEVIVYGASAARVAGVSMFALPGRTSESLLMAMDLDGVCLSNGSACSSGSVQPSHVLRAMGADERSARGALRVSMGWATTRSDIDGFLRSWQKIAARLNA